MLLASRDGYSCDQCGMTHRKDFSYYSFDFHFVSVCENRRPALNTVLAVPATFSADICPACFLKTRTALLEQHRKMPKLTVGLVCELSGKIMAGTFDYYYVDVAKVDVLASNQPLSCMSCRTKVADKSKPCPKCGSNKFGRLASIQTDRRHVEFVVSEDIYRTYVTAAERLRQVAGQWSVTS